MFSFKGVPTITLMLNEDINMDDLTSLENFAFHCTYEKNGKQFMDEISCKIWDVSFVRANNQVTYSGDK